MERLLEPRRGAVFTLPMLPPAATTIQNRRFFSAPHLDCRCLIGATSSCRRAHRSWPHLRRADAGGVVEASSAAASGSSRPIVPNDLKIPIPDAEKTTCGVNAPRPCASGDRVASETAPFLTAPDSADLAARTANDGMDRLAKLMHANFFSTVGDDRCPARRTSRTRFIFSPCAKRRRTWRLDLHLMK